MLRVVNGEQLERQQATSLGQEAIVSFARPSNTTAYSGGMVIGSTSSGVFAVVVSGEPNTSIYITNARVKMIRTGIPSGFTSFRLHWFTALPSGNADNTVFSVGSGDASFYKGYTDLDAIVDAGNVQLCQSQPLSKQIRLSSAQVCLAITTVTAFTPSSGTPYQVEFDYFAV